MTVGELKRELDDLPDEMLIVVPGYDHFYDDATLIVERAVDDVGEGLYTYYGPQNHPVASVPVDVVVIQKVAK